MVTRSHFENISTPCCFSPLAEIPGSVELLENSLTYEGVQWRKIIERVLRRVCKIPFARI